MSKWRIFLILLQLGFVYLAITWSFDAGRNYAGYCIAEDRILSDDEMIRIALSESNKGSAKYIYQLDGSGKRRATEDYIPYKSVGDMLKNNKNCCAFEMSPYTKSVGNLPPPVFLDRIAGVHRGYISLKLIKEYKDNLGNIKTKKTYNDYKISNCGILFH